MKKIAQFFKVGREQFAQDFCAVFQGIPYEDAEKIYEKIRLPRRATKGSAGYDIYTPVTYTLKPGESVKIPTGIRVKIENGWFLSVFPRSGLGFKFRLQMDNTVGIIDSDYFFAENEGHIFVKVTNDSREGKSVVLEAGTAFCQGIFLEYGITIDDETEGIRTGGLGSTDTGN